MSNNFAAAKYRHTYYSCRTQCNKASCVSPGLSVNLASNKEETKHFIEVAELVRSLPFLFQTLLPERNPLSKEIQLQFFSTGYTKIDEIDRIAVQA